MPSDEKKVIKQYLNSNIDNVYIADLRPRRTASIRQSFRISISILILNTSKDEEPLNLQTENIVYLYPNQFTGSWQASTSIFPFARHAASIAISTPPPAAN